MKAKNIVGKIYVSPMSIWGVLKHFVEAFKLQIVGLIGGTRPNLGATRPRVGICKSRLEALTCKYMNITNSSIASLGHRTPSWQCRRGDASPPG